MKFIKSFFAFIGFALTVVAGLVLFNSCSSDVADDYKAPDRNPGYVGVPEDQSNTPEAPEPSAEPSVTVTDPTAVQFSAYVTEVTAPVGFSTDTTQSDHPSFDVTCQASVCETTYVHTQDQLDGFAENFTTTTLTEAYIQAVKTADQTNPQSVTDTFNDVLIELTTVTYLNSGQQSGDQAPTTQDSIYSITVTKAPSSVE